MDREIPELNPPLPDEEKAASQKLSDAELREIDDAILSCCQDRWQKVAMVVGRSEMKLRDTHPALSYVFYSLRVLELIERGALEVQGNPRFIRFSEVRRPGM